MSAHCADRTECEKSPQIAEYIGGALEENWNQPAFAAAQLRRGTRFSDTSSPLAAPKRQRRRVAGATGLEPATSGVTGRRSNQLSYAPAGDVADLKGAPGQVKDGGRD